MEPRFSRRVPGDLRPNRISEALRRHPPAYDLTLSNPTLAGIQYPDDLLAPLAGADGLAYRPQPRGLAAARAAVAEEYRRHGAAVDAEHIVITASTSEAYAHLFKLLCEPGEAVLAPVPSYPLIEHLARVEGVTARPYHLEPESGWCPDIAELAAAGDDVRAVIAVHPNNPTGSFVDPSDAGALAELAARRGWALIVDEVFLDYPLGRRRGVTLAGERRALTFALGGLSKSVGLPQLKLAWIAVSGPAAAVEAALARLEFIADTFLSIATPVQLALPELLRRGAVVREAIRARCRANLAALVAAVAHHPAVGVAAPDGGWSAVLRIPAVAGEEELVLELLERDGVAVHPGFFFDFPREGYLVVNLLPEPVSFAEGIDRVLRRVGDSLRR